MYLYTSGGLALDVERAPRQRVELACAEDGPTRRGVSAAMGDGFGECSEVDVIAEVISHLGNEGSIGGMVRIPR